MRALEANYRIFTLMCILPSDNHINRWTKLRNILFTAYAVLSISVCLLSSIFFVLKYSATDLEGSLYATFLVAALSAALYTYFAGFVLRHQIMDIFSAFQDIYEHNKGKDSTKAMLGANQRGEWMVNFFHKYLSGTVILNLATLTILSLAYGWFSHGPVNVDALYRPYKLVFPWNQHCLTGWMAEIVVNLSLAVSYTSVNPAFLTLFISFCEYHRAFYEIFRDQFDKINKMVQKTKLSRINDVKEAVYGTIAFHISVKRLFRKTAHVCSTFILIQVICTTVLLSCCVFQMDLAIHHLDIAFVLMVFAIIYGATNGILYCYFGKIATDYYASFADCLYHSNWIVLPNELQRLYVLMIAHAQIPLSYHGFNIVDLNLGLFLRMLKTIISYYLMFKTLIEK